MSAVLPAREFVDHRITPLSSVQGEAVTLIADVAAGPARVRRTGLPWQAVLPWLLPALALVAWHGLSVSGALSATVMPGPIDVWRAAVELAARGELQRDVLVSLRRVALGFVLGGGTGLLLGFAVGLSRLSRALLDRSLQMLRTIPHLALVPLMIVWFGIGEEPRFLLVALGTLFPVYLNTVAGIRNVDPRLLELGRSYGLGPLALVVQVVLPAALQPILTGVRYALGVAWLTLVVGETIASRDGIGYMVQNARELLRLDIIVLAILLYALAGWLADYLTRQVERRVLRWHPSYAQGVAA